MGSTVGALYLILLLIYTSLAISENDLIGEEFIIDTEKLSDPYQVDLDKLHARRPRSDSKVIGGDQAEKFAFPYQVAFYSMNGAGSWFCGGSLISPNYVITAAHCIFKKPHRILVILGNENLRSRSKYEVRVDVDRYVRHKNYNTYSLKNDVCVLHLKNPVKYSKAIQPISLPAYRDAHVNYLNKVGFLSGYGYNYDGGHVNNQLMYLTVRVMDNQICNEAFNDRDAEGTNICTSGRQGGACHGDSGGPLVIDNKLLGIVSYGAKICSSGQPTVYTRVPTYLKWIAANTNLQIRKF